MCFSMSNMELALEEELASSESHVPNKNLDGVYQLLGPDDLIGKSSV